MADSSGPEPAPDEDVRKGVQADPDSVRDSPGGAEMLLRVADPAARRRCARLQRGADAPPAWVQTAGV